MSKKATEHVWINARFGGSRLLVLLAIARFAKGWRARITIATLCREVRLGERYVQNVLRLLEGAGWIERLQKPGRASVYRVTGGRL